MTSILGGGLGGLSSAYYLLRGGVHSSRIKLFESSSRLGGWIRSVEENGVTFECGPRTIRPVGEPGRNTLALLEELNLENAIIPILRSSPAAQRRLIYVRGQLHVLPSSFKSLFKKTSPFSRPLITALFHDLRTGKSLKSLEDESIYDFTKRRFGQEMADYAISPMICGICAGNAKEISVKFLMKDIFEKEQRYGGVIRGLLADRFSGKEKKATETLGKLASRARDEKWAIYSLEGGLETLPETLKKHLQSKDVSISLESDCEEINFSPNGINLSFKDKKEKSKSVISTLPAYKLAEIVRKQHPKLGEMLSGIPYVDVGVVNLHFSSPDALKEKGFGFLAAPSENIPILGVIFDSCCFDMKDSTVLTVMMGGHWFKQHFGESPTEDTLLSTARKYLKDILKIEDDPENVRVNILKKCIPQYVIGHHARVEAIREYLRDQKLPLGLAGAAYDGVGVNDVILSARKAAEQHFS
ncbi:Protoporphyrinogen oxidase [Sergentomyia squamirostris]